MIIPIFNTRSWLLVLFVLPFMHACSQVKPSPLSLELGAGIFLPLEETDGGSGKAWTKSQTDSVADRLAIDKQSGLLDQYLFEDKNRTTPLTPGIRFHLVKPFSAPSNSSLRFTISSRAPIVRCELFAADGLVVLANHWIFPPVWVWSAATWLVDIPLQTDAVVGGFRFSTLRPEDSLSVNAVRLSKPDPVLRLDPETLILPAGVRILAENQNLLVEWPAYLTENQAAGLTGVQLQYSAGAGATSTQDMADISLIGGQGSVSSPKQTSFDLRIRPGQRILSWYPGSLGFMPSSLFFDAKDLNLKLQEIRFILLPPAVGINNSPAPIPGDLWTMLDYRQSAWRDPRYEVFAWNLFPDILMIDFGTKEIQARFLKRLIFFTEKKGFRGTIQPDSVIDSKHGWNANDFRSESLAAFFNLARQENFKLNSEEIELARLAEDWGLIKLESEGYVPVKGGFVSVARGEGMPASLRALLLQHECIHGIFFANEEFRLACEEAFQGLSAPTKQFLTDYFSFYQYDPSDHYLMVNEMAAYLLQQSLPNLRGLVTTTMVNNYGSVNSEERAGFSRRANAALGELTEVANNLAARLREITGIVPAQLACLIPR